jgi:hypothetical protein
MKFGDTKRRKRNWTNCVPSLLVTSPMHHCMVCQQTGVLQLPTMAHCKPQKRRLHVPAIAWQVLGITGFLLAESRLALPVRSQSAVFRRDPVRFLVTMIVKDLNSNCLSLSPLLSAA